MYKKIFTHNSCIDKANIRRGGLPWVNVFTTRWYQGFVTSWISCKYSDLEEYEKGSDYDNTMPIVVGIILGVCLGWFSNLRTLNYILRLSEHNNIVGVMKTIKSDNFCIFFIYQTSRSKVSTKIEVSRQNCWLKSSRSSKRMALCVSNL